MAVYNIKPPQPATRPPAASLDAKPMIQPDGGPSYAKQSSLAEAVARPVNNTRPPSIQQRVMDTRAQNRQTMLQNRMPDFSQQYSARPPDPSGMSALAQALGGYKGPMQAYTQPISGPYFGTR